MRWRTYGFWMGVLLVANAGIWSVRLDFEKGPKAHSIVRHIGSMEKALRFRQRLARRKTGEASGEKKWSVRNPMGPVRPDLDPHGFRAALERLGLKVGAVELDSHFQRTPAGELVRNFVIYSLSDPGDESGLSEEIFRASHVQANSIGDAIRQTLGTLPDYNLGEKAHWLNARSVTLQLLKEQMEFMDLAAKKRSLALLKHEALRDFPLPTAIPSHFFPPSVAHQALANVYGWRSPELLPLEREMARRFSRQNLGFAWEGVHDEDRPRDTNPLPIADRMFGLPTVLYPD